MAMPGGRTLSPGSPSPRLLGNSMIAGAILWFAGLGLLFALRSGNDQYFPLVRNVGQYGSAWHVPDVPILAGSFPVFGLVLFGLGAGWVLVRRDVLATGPLARLGGIGLLLGGVGPLVAAVAGLVGLPLAVGVIIVLVSVLAAAAGSLLAAVALLFRSGPARLPAVLWLLGIGAFLPVDPQADLSGRMPAQIVMLSIIGVSWLWLGWIVRRASGRSTAAT